MGEYNKGYITDENDINLINLIQYNPNLAEGEFIQAIGGIQQLKEFFRIVDKDVQADSISNTRFYDLGWEIFKSVVLTYHVKNSRYINRRNLLNDLPIDMISTVGTDFILHVLTDLKRGHIEYGISPASSEGTYEERLTAALKIWNKIFSLSSLEDIKHGPGEYKIMKRSTINFLVARYLNSLIKSGGLQSKEDIVALVKNKFETSALSFVYEIEKISKNVMGDQIDDPDVFNEIFTDLKEYFTKNTRQMLRVDPITSQLKIYWSAPIGIFLDSGQKLIRNQLPPNTFIIKKINGRQVRQPLGDGPYSSSLMVIHDKDGMVGLMDPKEIKNMYYTEQVAGEYIRREIFEGYLDTSTNTIYSGVFVCNDEGNYLLSRLLFVNGEAVIRNEEWYEGDDFIKKHVLEGDSLGHFKLKYYRSLSWTTGDQCIVFLQAVDSNIYPTDKYNPPVPLGHYIKRSKSEEIEPLTSFLNPDYLAGVNIEQNIKAILVRESLFLESKFQYEHSGRMGILPIDDDWGHISDRNSVKVGDQVIAGPDRDQINALLKRFFGGTIDLNNLDHRIYKVLNYEFIAGTTERTVKNMVFRKYTDASGNKMRPFKPWMKEVLQMFKGYNLDTINPDKIDKLIIESDIRNQVFTTTSKEDMTHADWKLAQSILGVMERIFGGYTVKKLMTGTMFMNTWGVRYTVCPWRTMHGIYTELGISLPHNEFIGKVADQAHSGYPSTSIRIQKFIIDSLISPWLIDGNMMLQGLSTEVYNPLFNIPQDQSLYFAYFGYISEFMFDEFVDWSEDERLLEENQAYARLGDILIDLLKQQILKDYTLKLILKDPSMTLTKSDISLYQRLAIQCVKDCLYNARWAQQVRKDLYEFLISEGRKDFIVDFSQGRNRKVFGEGNPLEQHEGFYRLHLQLADFQSSFGKNWAEMADSISSSLQMSKRFEPQNIIGKDRIIQIAEFLKDIAKRHGKIRLYGFRVNSNGYGNKRNDKMVYFPTHSMPNIDKNMPSSNQWYYEIDPNDFNSFTIKQFRIFLGALFADHQGIFIRIEEMLRGEFLFAFDALGVLEETDITIAGDDYRRPATPSKPLYFSLPSSKYLALKEKWNSIIQEWKDNLLITQCHKFYTIKEWHKYLSKLGELNDLTSSFGSLGSD